VTPSSVGFSHKSTAAKQHYAKSHTTTQSQWPTNISHIHLHNTKKNNKRQLYATMCKGTEKQFQKYTDTSKKHLSKNDLDLNYLIHAKTGKKINQLINHSQKLTIKKI